MKFLRHGFFALLMLLLATSCVSLKRHKTKLSLASCQIELLSGSPILEGVEPLIRVPLEDGSERVHYLSNPSFDLFVDFLLIQQGIAFWEVQNAGIALDVKLTNRSKRPLWLDSTLVTLQIDSCSLPLRLQKPLELKVGPSFVERVEVRTTITQSTIDCVDRAQVLGISLRTRVQWEPEDPEPVWIEWKEERPFPTREVQEVLEQSKKKILSDLFQP